MDEEKLMKFVEPIRDLERIEAMKICLKPIFKKCFNSW